MQETISCKPNQMVLQQFITPEGGENMTQLSLHFFKMVTTHHGRSDVYMNHQSSSFGVTVFCFHPFIPPGHGQSEITFKRSMMNVVVRGSDNMF